MAIVGRIIAVSLLVAGLGVVAAQALFGRYPDWTGIAILLGSLGAIIGAVAGAAREIANTPRRPFSSGKDLTQ